MDIASGSHAIGPDNGALLIRAYKDGIGARLAHDLVLTATRWAGTVTVDAKHPTASIGTVLVDATSIEIIEATGGIVGLTSRDRKEIGRTIDRKVLRTAEHPELRFDSTSVSGTDPEFTVTGTMTITGATRPVQVDVRVAGVDLTATIRLSQRAFGIEPHAALFGAIRLRDDVDLELTTSLPPA